MPRYTCALILICTLCAPVVVLAADVDNGWPRAASAGSTYQWVDGVWIETSDAVAYNSGTSNGHCNRRCWETTIESSVSVAQWVEWNVRGTRRDWPVLKPGTFAQATVKARVRSNNAVHISLWMDNPTDLHAASGLPPIERSFSHGAGNSSLKTQRHTWNQANDYSAEAPFTMTIPDEPVLRDGVSFNVWEMIEITEQHRVTDYYGTGSMVVCVSNLMHWIDAEVGGVDPGSIL